MPPSRGWFLVALVLAAVGPAAAQRPASSPLADSVGTRPDSLDDPIVGVWVSDADPKGTVSIGTWGPGRVTIEATGRFSALAFFDGRELVGLTLPASTGETRALVQGVGILRARERGNHIIEAEFARDLDGPIERREVWRLRQRFGPQPPDTSHETPGEPLPALGDFVYIEDLPEPIEKVPPDFPEWARKRGIEGTVMIQALVGRDGRVKDARVLRSIPELDDYAVAAVKQWRFKPARAKGRPVAVWVAVPVRFTLK